MTYRIVVGTIVPHPRHPPITKHNPSPSPITKHAATSHHQGDVLDIEGNACGSTILNADRLQIVVSTAMFMERMWQQSNCNSESRTARVGYRSFHTGHFVLSQFVSSDFEPTKKSIRTRTNLNRTIYIYK